MSNFFGYITLTPGTRMFANVGASGLSGVLIGNESGYTVTITLQGANTSRSLYPGLVDWFPIHPGFNGTIQIDPVALLTNTSSWPGSYLQIDTFGLGEAPTGIYPLALSRTFNIGNTVNTAMGNATNLVNDANVAGTQIIEATPGTDSSSAVTLTNDGVLTIGNSTHPGSVSFDNAKITSDGSGNLSVQKLLAIASGLGLSITGHLSSDGGAITTDGSGNISAKAFNPNTAAVTGGTASLYQFMQGTVKAALVIQNGTSGAALNLPTAFATGALVLAVGTQFDPGLNGLSVTYTYVSQLWNGSSSSTGSTSASNPNVLVYVPTTFNQIGVGNIKGAVLAIGV